MSRFPKYEYLTVKIELPNLCEGEVYDLKKLLKKIELFKTYSDRKGLYVIDKDFIPYHNRGLHYLSFDKLIRYLTEILAKNVRVGRVCCSETGICFECFEEVRI